VDEKHRSPQGPDFYDDPDVFRRYFEPRRPSDSPVYTMETPAVDDVLGDVAGLTVLEMGCGDGEFGIDLLRRGITEYVGIDGSERMVEAARRRLDGTGSTLERRDIGSYEPPSERFDLVVSLRVLHYVADLPAVLRRAAHALRPGGRLIYTHEHPVITSFDTPRDHGRRQDWTVDDYFRSGPRDVDFLGHRVVKYHRTVEEHLAAIDAAGLDLTAFRECPPVRERFGDDEAEYERRLRIPLFVLLVATKPAVTR
jgi:SAM-dependent methyltransferase